MAILTIRNMPDELHAKLKERAKRNRRSLNQEVIAELAEIINNTGSGAAQERWQIANQLVDEMRSRMQGLATSKEIQSAIKEGRR